MDADVFPQYLRIALDMAEKIAAGELEERQKLSGRSLLASAYAVSPETIRKAVGLLANMKVVEVREKSGVVVLSRDNARRYLELLRSRRDELERYAQFRTLYERYSELGREMMEAGSRLMAARLHPTRSQWALPQYELRVPEGSGAIGRSLCALRFWQETGATIVAIRRSQEMIVSPGPDAELYAGDTVLFVGGEGAPAAVERFLGIQRDSMGGPQGEASKGGSANT